MRHRRNFPFLLPFLFFGGLLGAAAIVKKTRTTTRREEDYEPPSTPAAPPSSYAEPPPTNGGINLSTATPRQLALSLTVFEREESLTPAMLATYQRAWARVVAGRSELRRAGMNGRLDDDIERLQTGDMPFDRQGYLDRDTQTLVRDSIRRIAGLPRATTSTTVTATEGWTRY